MEKIVVLLRWQRVKDYAHQHPVAFAALLIWAWTSITLILRMWFVYRRESLARMFFWSLVLAIPFAGFFTPRLVATLPVPTRIHTTTLESFYTDSGGESSGDHGFGGGDGGGHGGH